jgi:hypothetical protein
MTIECMASEAMVLQHLESEGMEKHGILTSEGK